MFDLAANYGLGLPEKAQGRVEGWIGVTDIEITVRETTDVSPPLLVQLNTPVMVDVGPDGRLTVEGIDTLLASYDLAYWAGVGKIDYATTCWKEGKIVTSVNNVNLPTVTVHEEGLKVLDKAFGLGIGNTAAQFFTSRAGVDVSFNGQHEESASCGE